MKYPSQFESIVGFQQIRNEIAQRCRFETSVKMANDFSMLTKWEDIESELGLLDEANILLGTFPSIFQFNETADISLWLKHIDIENYFFMEDELLAILRVLQSYQKVFTIIHQRQEQFPRFATLFLSNYAVKPCSDLILKVIEEDASLKPNASPIYQKLTQEINRLEREIRNQTKSIFREWKQAGYTAETDVTVREERLVIPIIAEFKRKVQGFVKDISATGKILYVEPTAILEMNNLLKELYAERRREREKILKQLTSDLKPFHSELNQLMMQMSMTDFIYAKQQICANYGANRPRYSEVHTIVLKNAFHPVLKKELGKQNQKIVPLSLQMHDKRIVVVSGPNAGGKSVVLKTALLLQYMFQCGLYVTALPESEFSVFEFLAIDCGDGQSIEQGLSTFSAHLSHLKAILAQTGPNAFIGLDEIGAGTDPRFGAPIAQALMEQLLEKGAFAIATTHFSQLREWGLGIEHVAQASMAYDAKGLKPLYTFVMGKPGSSFALELMRKTGFDENWMKRIEELTGKEIGKTEDMMLHLEQQNQYLLTLITDNEQKSPHLNELQEEYGKLKEKLQSKRKEVVDMARWEAQKLLSDTNQQIENTIRIIREHGAKKEPTMKARKQLDQFKESVNTAADKSQQKIVPQNQPKPAEVTAVPIKASEILPGTKVKNKMSDQEGEVIEVKKNKVQVAFGLLKMWVPIEELQMSRSVAGNSKQKAKVGFNWVERQATFSLELDLRGVRGDEAVLKLQKWLDEAYALGQGTIKIIHGRGDGILKKLLRQHLKTINFVKRYYDEHADRGGDGCTYVELM